MANSGEQGADRASAAESAQQRTASVHESGASAPPTASGERESRPSPVLRQQWQEEFPYHWSADDLVTRRDTLRFLVGSSGALVVASAALAITGAVRAPSVRHVLPIAKVDELPVNGSKVFAYPNSYADGILVNLPEKGLVAYSDECTHLSCAVLYQQAERQFYCPCHEGRFDAYTGEVLGGPPTRPLPIIRLNVSGDTVYAVEEVER